MSDFLPFLAAGFVAQMIDGMLGMGYGVSATSFLLSFGVTPAMASASVHTAEVVATGFSGASHWANGNVALSYVKKLMIPGIIGAVIGAYILTSIPGGVMKPIIAAYLMIMGIVILFKARRKIETTDASETKLVPLGLAGGFFDAIGGGGWGPIVVGTLLARGNPPRITIGSVNFAEFFVTIAASATLLLTIGVGSWEPIAGLAVGSALAAPLAAKLTGKIPARPLLISVGILVIVLSLRTIYMSLR